MACVTGTSGAFRPSRRHSDMSRRCGLVTRRDSIRGGAGPPRRTTPSSALLPGTLRAGAVPGDFEARSPSDTCVPSGGRMPEKPCGRGGSTRRAGGRSRASPDAPSRGTRTGRHRAREGGVARAFRRRAREPRDRPRASRGGHGDRPRRARPSQCHCFRCGRPARPLSRPSARSTRAAIRSAGTCATSVARGCARGCSSRARATARRPGSGASSSSREVPAGPARGALGTIRLRAASDSSRVRPARNRTALRFSL